MNAVDSAERRAASAAVTKKKIKKGRWPLTRVEEGGGVEMKITAITKLQSSVSHTAPDGCTDPTLSRVERGIKKDGGSWRRLS